MKKLVIAGVLFLVGSIFFNIVCQEHDLQQKITELSAQQPFVLFDLGLTQDEVSFLQDLTIHKVGDDYKPVVLNFFGRLDQFEAQVIDYIKALGNSEKDACLAAKLIYKVVADCLFSMHNQAAWVAIRAFKKSNVYDLPRWHIDSEQLYKPSNGFLCKVVCALKGASTMLCHVSNKGKADFLRAQSAGRLARNETSVERDFRLRKNLVDVLVSYSKQAACPGQGAVFIMGSEALGAIHSEPAMSEDRIFMQIVSGTDDEIAYLYEHWHHRIEDRFKKRI